MACDVVESHMTDGRVVSDLLVQQTIDIGLFLRSRDFASDFPMSLLTDLTERIRVVDVPDGQAIIRIGERVEWFYLVREGIVDVFGDEKEGKPVAAVGSGKTFGEASLLGDEPSAIRAVARGPVKLFVVKGAEYTAALDSALSQRDELINALMARRG